MTAQARILSVFSTKKETSMPGIIPVARRGFANIETAVQSTLGLTTVYKLHKYFSVREPNLKH